MRSIKPVFDRTPLLDVTPAVFDQEAVHQCKRLAHFLDRLEDDDHNIWEYLLRCGGIALVPQADQVIVCPTIAGILTFTRQPERWIPASGIDIVIFSVDRGIPTTNQTLYIRGPIFTIINDAVDILIQECAKKDAHGDSQVEIPFSVLRELTMNAIIHSDFSIVDARVVIQICPDQIEWISPGGLPDGITVDTLRTAQFSRNPSLSQFLFHAGLIEKFGLGLDSVLDALQNANLQPPEFYDDKHSFRVRIYRNPVPMILDARHPSEAH